MRSRHTHLNTLVKNYYLFIRDFFADLFDDKLGHYASSLSWSTLFALIPLLAIFMAIFTQLPLFDTIYHEIEELFSTNLMPIDSEVVMEYINTFIANSDKLGFVGALYILIATVMFFKNYDYIVNDIFHLPSRTIIHALKTYLFLLITLPLLMTSSFLLSSYLQGYLDQSSITDSIHLYSIVPYLMIWMVFYVAYQLSPNTSIKLSASLISSFITSLVWYLSKMGFILYVLHNKTYTSIYGSISTLLFFFLWIYISWAIFIHGLKFCALLNQEEEIEHI
jgi:membrane protein